MLQSGQYGSQVKYQACSLVTLALVVINDEMNGAGVEERIQLLRGSLGEGSRHLGGDGVLEYTRHLVVVLMILSIV